MTTRNCDCEISCTGKALIASVIIGILAGVFRYIALITVAPAFLWALFGIAIVFLGITLLTSSCYTERRGCCQYIRLFLAGILGTILTSVILLGITFAVTSVLGAIITGLLLFFFSFTVITTTCIILCRYNCD